MEKFVAIGDIHGCGKTLQQLLTKLEKYHDRTFVFIGDYIDRGPNSKLTIDLLLELKANVNCIFLKGNHELMMEEAFRDQFPVHWTRNGGLQTMISLGIKNVNGEMPEPYGQFIKDTVLFHESDEYFFVHGGLPPLARINDLKQGGDLESLLWERSHIHAPFVDWEKKVVFGHTPLETPLIEGKKIGIDTGCVFYNTPGMGKLSAILLPENKIIQHQYCEF